MVLINFFNLLFNNYLVTFLKLRSKIILRITAGYLKGRMVKFQPGDSKARPTSSLIRQAIFNTLGSKTLNTNFLDLYSGSGIIGFEALSRGANSVTFVEQNRQLCAYLTDNINIFEAAENTFLINHTVEVFFNKIIKNAKFDIIYADPPYKSKLQGLTLNLIANHDVLTDNGMVIIESSLENSLNANKGALEKKYPNLIFVKTKKYGQTELTIYAKDPS